MRCVRGRIVDVKAPYRESGNFGEPNGFPFNTCVCDVETVGRRIRVCPMTMFWLPYCDSTPTKLDADALMHWESAAQKYPASPRPAAIRGILESWKPFLTEADEVPMVVAGDFNSHSHLDWTAETRAHPFHEGRIVPWAVSSQMAAAGFRDAYRGLYSNPAANYGATHPQPGVKSAKVNMPFLRLDYVYSCGKRLRPVSAEVIGGDYHRPFTWCGHSFDVFPSDHAAVVVEFEFVPTEFD